ncbi:hypothetical protein ANCCAN_03882 [Ancylostoma caninum]|uniref:Uncharacterized protein n=1 Tax=Ancylostoma caninum TaxID=29170 RepID=A0A368H0B9_ANCCA|nr:hypothetical protein ANCCAN_03882 [Ancylostoma caninum]
MFAGQPANIETARSRNCAMSRCTCTSPVNANQAISSMKYTANVFPSRNVKQHITEWRRNGEQYEITP